MKLERTFIDYTTEAQWLALRDADLTSTEVSALFGCSPYATAYEMFHRKNGQLVVEFESNDRVRWGNRLETAIAFGIAEDLGLIVEPFKVYGRIEKLRMGSSFDFKIVGLAPGFTGDDTYRDLFRKHGPGIMEVKNVDGLQFRRTWISEGEVQEAPAHIELQVQHQLEVADLEWTVIAPLIGGNTPMPFARLRDREIGGAIREKVKEFWSWIKKQTPPAPDYAADGEVIAQLLGEDNGESIDMSDNARLAEVRLKLTEAGDAEKKAKETKDACKAEILHIVGNNRKILVQGGYINANTVKDSPGTLIEPQHIGTRIGGRKGYRNVRFYPSSK